MIKIANKGLKYNWPFIYLHGSLVEPNVDQGDLVTSDTPCPGEGVHRCIMNGRHTLAFIWKTDLISKGLIVAFNQEDMLDAAGCYFCKSGWI